MPQYEDTVQTVHRVYVGTTLHIENANPSVLIHN